MTKGHGNTENLSLRLATQSAVAARSMTEADRLGTDMSPPSSPNTIYLRTVSTGAQIQPVVGALKPATFERKGIDRYARHFRFYERVGKTWSINSKWQTDRRFWHCMRRAAPAGLGFLRVLCGGERLQPLSRRVNLPLREIPRALCLPLVREPLPRSQGRKGACAKKGS